MVIPDTLIFVPLKNATVETPAELSDPRKPKLPTGATNPCDVVIIPVAWTVSAKSWSAVDIPEELKSPVRFPVTSPVTSPTTSPVTFPTTFPVILP